jgi:hypothetical protein
MATPFDTTAPAAKLATTNQLVKAIGPMLADRNWQAGPAAWVERVAVISTVLNFAQTATDPSVQAQLDIVLSDPADVATSFEELMDFLAASARNDERDDRLWKPLTAAGASKLIDWLGAQPWAGSTSKVEEANVAAAKASVAADRTAGTIDADTVPAGRYAVATEAGAVNELAFYKVDRPTTGRWAGYVFVKLLVSDDEQRLSKAASAAVLAKIAAVGAEAASAAYGLEIGECGVCSRTLTNDESRERGIGPKCAAKMGW